LIKGLYTASSSMLTAEENLNIISNNLANVSTNGYKKDQGIQRSFPELLISRIEKGKRPAALGSIGTGVVMEESFTDFEQGGLTRTGGQLDFALEGSGFFVIQSPEGIRYTRNGNFTLNSEGELVTAQGYHVMGERGPVQTVNTREISVTGDGQLFLGDIPGDRLLVVDFPEHNTLEKVGDNLYQNEIEGEPVEDYSVRQGFLENSNVNIIREMAAMIQANRYYESNQKVIHIMDGTLDKAVNSIASIR